MVNTTIDFIFRLLELTEVSAYICFGLGMLRGLGVSYDVEKCPKVGGRCLIYDVD